MPGRNIVKQYAAEQFYHVYNRGVAKQAIFEDAPDYLVFLSLFKRYLSNQPAKTSARLPYPWYKQRLELIAYCLMPNHVHLLVYQNDEKALVEFMRSLMTSYSMYFNKKYERVGPVFQSRYRASRISSDPYLEHITRYIHLNPRQWQNYPYSSINYYRGQTAEWLQPQKVLDSFSSSKEYLSFLEDYEDHKRMLDELKWELAHE